MIDRRIKLRHLICFVEIAHRRSLSKAADALAMSQPAVSKTLKELEEIVGVVLIERDRRGAVLTDYGQVLLPRAASCLHELQGAVDSVSHQRTIEDMRVRVGVLPTVAASIAPRAVERFRAGGPGAVVHLVTGPNGYLLDLLRSGSLDLVIGRLAAPEQMAKLSFLYLYSEVVRFVVRPDHPLLSDRPFNLRRIADFPVLLPDPQAVIRPSVERLLISHGISALNDRVESVSNAFGRTYTRDTDIVWIISHGVVDRDLRDGLLVALDIDTSDTSGAVGLTVRADMQPNAGMRSFIQAVRAAAASDGHGRRWM